MTCVYVIEDLDSIENVELSGELSRSKSRPIKVWSLIYFTIVCWLFAIITFTFLSPHDQWVI